MRIQIGNSEHKLVALLTLHIVVLVSIAQGSEENPPYDLVASFPLLPLSNPIFLGASGDNSNRLFVAEKSGLIRVFNPGNIDTGTVFLDARPQARDFRPETGLLGMAFHPEFETNGRLFIHYSGRTLQSVLSEFRVSSEDPNLADPEERVILEIPQPTDLHNGGQLAFGPDGYLYMSLGDGSAPEESHDHAQDRTTLLGSILRIDIDVERKSNYGIPSDNPFVGNDQNWREEIWAYGFRNPWRFSFDPDSGLIFVGDVGDRKREEINLVERGGNYGWRRMEGSLCRDQAGCTTDNLQLPIHEYGRDQGSAVIGGYVYQGDKYSDLTDAYIYGDFASRKVWALRREGPGWRNDLLAVAENYILALGQDAQGEIFVLTSNEIFRFEPAPNRTPPPSRFSQTGFFTQQSAPEVLPYTVNAPFWSDGAEKKRYLSLPADSTIDFSANGAWHFPAGSTLIKSFYLEKKIVETRLLIKRPSHPGWDGYSYRWNDEGNEAFLLGVGHTEEYEVAESGSTRLHQHIFPSPSQCGSCHTAAAGYVLGVRTDQLNRGDQIQAWEQNGLFTEKLPASSTWGRLVDPADESVPLDIRARAYLSVNCASCHRPGNSMRAELDLRFTTPLENTGLLNAPQLGTIGASADSRLLIPGEPKHSVAYLRMIDTGTYRMPPLASNRIDSEGATVIQDWIEGLQAATSIESSSLSPHNFTLSPPYPNPTNNELVISFSLSATELTKLEIFNASGQKLETLLHERMPTGQHHIRWQADRQASGVYFIRLTAGVRSSMRKAMLLR